MQDKSKNHKTIYIALVLLTAAVLAAGCASQPTTTENPVTVHEAEFAQANGITLAYESYGPIDRETILLIGGTGQQLIDWPPELIEELVRRGYHVVIYDNRDIGLSTKLTSAGLPDNAAIQKAIENGETPPLPYTLQDMADDAVGLMDPLGIEKAHVVGVSMGGSIGQWVAINHPDRILSLTSLMSDSGNAALPVIAKPEAFANVPPPPAAGDTQGLIEYQVKTLQALSSPGYPTDESKYRAQAQRQLERGIDLDALLRQQTVSFIGHYDTEGRYAKLKTIHVPTVVLHGDDDPLVPVESAHDLAASIPGADLRIIPGLGHEIPVQLVNEFADAITSAAKGT
jgi:pimeloyl-ACP methyl ester carboxylesterase